MLVAAAQVRGRRAAAINGEASGERNEATRLAFQTGQLDLVVFTVRESISLHRGELPGGDRVRSLVIHDMRHSATQMAQIEGRCHRDGEAALIHYAYAEDTVEDAVAELVVGWMVGMDAMAGDRTGMLDAMVDWLRPELVG